jgi:hypothetical protein
VTPLIDNCPLIKRGRRLFFALIDDPCSVFMSCICLASIIGHLLNIQLRFWDYPVDVPLILVILFNPFPYLYVYLFVYLLYNFTFCNEFTEVFLWE